MITMGQRDVVIIGASLAGLFAAAVAAVGARAMIVERDVLPDGPMPRNGVPQSRQPMSCCIAGSWPPKSWCPVSARSAGQRRRAVRYRYRRLAGRVRLVTHRDPGVRD